MKRDLLRDAQLLLTGVAAVGLACFLGTRKGRSVLERLRSWVQEGQQRLCDLQEVLEEGKQLLERGRELFDESRQVARRGWQVVKTG